MGVEQWTVNEPYLHIPCKLGEGVFYNEERDEIRFVDIISCKLYIIDLKKGPESLRTIDTHMPIGVTADIQDIDSSQIILAGAKDGITKFNLQTGEHEYLAKYWPEDDTRENARRQRSNDGNVDANGRFWNGTLVDPEIEDPTDEAVVFLLESGKPLRRMYEKIKIPNGIVWTAKGDTMYLSDTTEAKLYVFDYDAKTGDISNKRLFYKHEGPGNPDGHTIDAEGNIWQALYGGSKVIRISPQGEVTGEIHLPTQNITCPIFAGTSLFITTAADKESDKSSQSAKYGGSLFKVDVGVRGLPKHKFRL